jgi:apolipoprotein N-acyltransferase
MWYLAWIAWVPLFYLCEEKSLRHVVLNFFSLGFLSYLLLMSWLIPTTVVGWILISVYISLYFACFGVAFFYGKDRPLGLSIIWVILEIIREYAFTGLPWLPLGLTQSSNIMMRQSAVILGVYGLSFLVIFVNITLWNYLKPIKDNGIQKIFFYLALTLLMFNLFYGYQHQSDQDTGSMGSGLDVVAIHSKIPLDMKWDKNRLNEVVSIYEEETRKSFKGSVKTDLILWPETAIPEYVRRRPPLFRRIAQIAKDSGAYLMLGCLDVDMDEGRGKDYYNTSLLVSPEKTIVQKYDKIRVLPFGEYTPFKGIFPWLSYLVKSEAEFTPGQYNTVFKTEKAAWASLICYEDSFTAFPRQFVLQGLDFVVVSSNDAWFWPHQVLQRLLQAQMRAVEYGCPVIRVSNFGTTCWIDAKGNLRDVRTTTGALRFELPVKDHQKTLYAHFGLLWFWVLTGGYFLFIVSSSIFWYLKKHYCEAE